MNEAIENPADDLSSRPSARGWKTWVRRSLIVLSIASVILSAIIYWLVFIRVSNGSLKLDRPLRIPSELVGVEENGRWQFRLVVDEGTEEFLPEMMTRTAGVNGPYLGPTLRVRRGQSVDFEVVNHLDQETTMHWHGMHVPAKMDGTPHQVIGPGAAWTASIEVDQPASTLWYHPHPHGETGRQAYSGISGLLIVDDGQSDSLELPTEYGVDDIPLVIQDRRFDSKGQFDYALSRGAVYGDEILVNGTWNPAVEVPSRLVRLRLLNGSNARVYHVGFQDDRLFDQIATDGGFLETPFRTDRLILAPGERAEILVDFSDGQPTLLKSFPEGDFLQTLEFFFDGAGSGHFHLLRMLPQDDGRESHPVPDRLATFDRLDENDASVTRVMNLGGFGRQGGRDGRGGQNRANDDGDQSGRQNGATRGGRRRTGLGNGIPINGQLMDMHRVDEVVRRGDTEIWEVVNRSGQPHPFHVHLVQFQLLDRNGVKPSGAELGWKDTVLVDAGERVRTIMRFDGEADPATPYMYHCHIMEHEDAGMMGQFLVVDEPMGLDETKDQVTVVLFILGFSCRHCFEQVQLFDQRLRDMPVKLVVVTPEPSVDREQVSGFQAAIHSDPGRQWAGWLGLMHDGPVHGTYLLDRRGERVWGDDGDEPYMDIDSMLDRIGRLNSGEQDR